ncbi:MAG TPA: hypothetical protein VGG40_04675 [Solirubrobacterales bacterium]
MTEVAAPTRRLCVRGAALAAALQERGITDGEPEHGLVLDLHDADPGSWPQLEELLVDAYALSKRAFVAGAPVVYVLDEASLYGHRSALRAMLATGLLGGVRSLAAEGVRHGLAANAVTLDDRGQLALTVEAVLWLLSQPGASGQVHHCGSAHVGRPAA